MIIVAIVLVVNQILVEGSNEDSKKKEAFYQKINESIRYQLQLYSKRSDCIINELKRNDIFGKVNESNYNFIPIKSGYNASFIITEAMSSELEAVIESASFSCTIVGYCAMVLLISVMLIVVICLSCLSMKK